tara:strand:+ start:471 stop:662 length:192 start_codon:yes stop_codon:yes gene_type:complete
MEKNRFFEEVNNYTKYKLVEMLIDKHQGKSLNNLNAIEDLSEDILDVLTICGLKFYGHMKHKK